MMWSCSSAKTSKGFCAIRLHLGHNWPVMSTWLQFCLTVIVAMTMIWHTTSSRIFQRQPVSYCSWRLFVRCSWLLSLILLTEETNFRTCSVLLVSKYSDLIFIVSLLIFFLVGWIVINLVAIIKELLLIASGQPILTNYRDNLVVNNSSLLVSVAQCIVYKL